MVAVFHGSMRRQVTSCLLRTFINGRVDPGSPEKGRREIDSGREVKNTSPRRNARNILRHPAAASVGRLTVTFEVGVIMWAILPPCRIHSDHRTDPSFPRPRSRSLDDLDPPVSRHRPERRIAPVPSWRRMNVDIRNIFDR